MEGNIRVSVRELVAFTYFEPHLLPPSSASAMLAGTRAHQARQAKSTGENERTIHHVYELDGIAMLVYGRMDIFTDGELPLVEEIKLGTGLREKPLAEHRAQALCYAAMLSCEKEIPEVRFCVCYVNEDGQLLQRFEERMSAQLLHEEMMDLLAPYAAFVKQEIQHRQKRNQSLQALSFPFSQYRPGQRELAAQVYTAIVRKKRLFASLPTGTGKSAAVLFPALKALGEGKTEQILYLTARGTARQSPLNALVRMMEQGMHARICVLNAREKLCPRLVRCHPDECERANGHFKRQKEAVQALLLSGEQLWDDRLILRWAETFSVCPFEFALRLTELADVVMLDLNHVFDPFAQIRRLMQRKSRCTLLADEAHHCLDRVRDNLSGTLDSRELGRIRSAFGKQYGRKTVFYQELGKLLRCLRDLECSSEEMTLAQPPARISGCVQDVLNAAFENAGKAGAQEVIRMAMPYLYALEHFDEDYAVLLEKHGKDRVLTLCCLLPGKEMARQTKGMRGAVFFSATLHPLPAMKQLLGGGEGDECFSLPSPFPKENLVVVRKHVDTRYQQREETAVQIADAIAEMAGKMHGNSIVYFPSYAYLEMVLAKLRREELPELWIQTREMGEGDRAAFLEAFEQTHTPRLGLCVLGGLFSEGIDLPGEQLVAAAIVGVGLPAPSVRIHALRACCQQHFGDGFAYACRIPGMQKVLQAAGRVIRSETDRGMVLLMDERYFEPEYEALLPPHWRVLSGEISEAVQELRK